MKLFSNFFMFYGPLWRVSAISNRGMTSSILFRFFRGILCLHENKEAGLVLVSNVLRTRHR